MAAYRSALAWSANHEPYLKLAKGAAQVVTTLLFATLAACASAATPSAPADADGEALVMGRIYNIQSTAFGDARRIVVRTPAGYEENTERRYDVVYVVDGGPEQDFPHIAGLAQSAEVNGTFAPLIIVGLETVNRRAEITPPVDDVARYTESIDAEPGGSENFRAFIANDVMPWINARYRASGRDALMGESLAGLFVIDSLFKAPDLFDDYIAVTPSLWWNDMEYGREATRLVSDLPAGDRRLYLALSDEGFLHKEGTERLVEALKTSAPDGLKWLYVPQGETENHASVYHGAALDAFRAFYGQPMRTSGPFSLLLGDTPPAPTDEEKARLEEPCTRDSARLTTPAKAPLDRNPVLFECVLYDFGPRAVEGNFER